MNQRANKVTINGLQALMLDVFKEGYGNTIELKINGEYYEVTK